MSVFRLTMLPASEGDGLILTYGETEASLRHIVIDGGRKATWPKLLKALAAIADRGETVELMVLSHIDADHIDGALEMAEAAELPIVPAAVWYNGFDQLKAMPKPGLFSPFGFRAADAYSAALAAKGWELNETFGGSAISIEARPRPFEFAGLELTLISPSRAKLQRLWKEWEKWRDTHPATLRPLGKRPLPATLDVEALSAASPGDSTAPNGSSIAFIAEYDGRRVLLGADAHPDVLLAALSALAPNGDAMRINLTKLPHHGSRANVTRAWLEKITCTRFAFSTSGAVFGHPDPEAVSRVLKFATSGDKTLFFNYASERTTPWDDPVLKSRWGYRCIFPPDEDVPLVIDI